MACIDMSLSALSRPFIAQLFLFYLFLFFSSGREKMTIYIA